MNKPLCTRPDPLGDPVPGARRHGRRAATAEAASGVEVIVQMDAGSAPAAGKAAVRAAGGEVPIELPIINGFAAELPPRQPRALTSADGVKAVTVD